MNKDLINILRDGRVFGIIGSKDSGKTTTLLDFIDCTTKNKEVMTYAYFYHQENKDKVKARDNLVLFNSLEEFEGIRDSFIFIDEFHTLFNLNDRHGKNTEFIKAVFNQSSNNGNVIVIASTTEYYNKLICSFLDGFILLRTLYKDIVRGSSLQSYINSIGTDLKGGTCFNVPVGKIFYKGSLISINYESSKDKKTSNKDLFAGFR